MKTLTETFEEILLGFGTIPNPDWDVINRELINAVKEYNKQVVGEDEDPRTYKSFFSESFSNVPEKIKTIIIESAVNMENDIKTLIRQRQEELI